MELWDVPGSESKCGFKKKHVLAKKIYMMFKGFGLGGLISKGQKDLIIFGFIQLHECQNKLVLVIIILYHV